MSITAQTARHGAAIENYKSKSDLLAWLRRAKCTNPSYVRAAENAVKDALSRLWVEQEALRLLKAEEQP